jgi:hypothetical protein
MGTDVPFGIREECIRSMYNLFEILVAVEPLDGAVFMWWDSLCYDWQCGNRDRRRGGEDLQLQDVMFEMLTRILWLNSATCRKAALHGLGHLHHPATQDIVDRYLREHPSLTQELEEYALAAGRFGVQ